MSVLFPKTITYYQMTGSYDEGIWDSAQNQSTFIGDVQPATGKELEILPVGRRDIGTVKVYSNTQLNVSKENSQNSGDIIIWENQKWEVVKELPYQGGLINHYKYIAQLRGAA